MDYINLDLHIKNLLIAKSNASLYSYQCDYNKENRCLIVKTKEKNLFEIPLKYRTIREVYTDLYYMIVCADIAPKLIDKIEKLQNEIKVLQSLNSMRNIE